MGGLLDGGELYAVYFRKTNVNVMVSTNSFAAAKEYARIIESKIEIQADGFVIDAPVLVELIMAVVIIAAVLFIVIERGVNAPQRLHRQHPSLLF